jgi:hypothetical protein
MMYMKKIICIKICILFITISSPVLRAQVEIKLPNEILLTVNGSELSLSQSWIDSLVDVASGANIYYKIVGAFRKESSVITVIQIPQILSINEVYRQIVLYYTILSDEESRQRELLNIYPYFESTGEDPAIRCQYFSDGKYEIVVEYWHRVPVPDQPIPEDKDIHNQILQISFHEVQSLGDISDDVFEKVAIKNDLSVQRIQEIYQNTILWQLGTQIYSK